MNQGLRSLFLTSFVLAACQREDSAEKVGSQTPQTPGTIDQAIHQTVEGINGPMDKARGVKKHLGRTMNGQQSRYRAQHPKTFFLTRR
jgi:hypothetical protein